MAEPKKKSTRKSKRMRTAKNKYGGASLTKCPKCSAEILPHHVCNVCGYYKGKKIIDLMPQTKAKTKVTKK